MTHSARCPIWVIGLLAAVVTGVAAQDASTLYRTAEAAFGDKAYDKAMVSFKAFYEKYPQDPRAARALHRIGECHGSLGSFDRAAQAFKLCYTRYPESNVADSAMFNEGFYYFRAQDWLPAAFAYFNYVKKGTNEAYRAQAWYWRAEALYQLRRFSDAVTAYQAMLELPADVLKQPAVAELVPYARYSTAVCYYEDKQYDKALAATRQVTEKHPEAPVVADSLWYGGQALRALGQVDQAVSWFKRLADDYPKSSMAPEALYAMFEIEQKRGDQQAAQQAMARLTRDYPDAQALAKGARFRLAAEKLEAKEFAAAQKLYREALEGTSGETEAAGLLGLAEASFGLQQWAEAAKAYRQLLTKYPKDRNADRARLRLGEVLLRQESFAEAEALYRDYLKSKPKSPDAPLAQYNLAYAVYRQGREEEAVELFREVARLDPRGDIGGAALLEVGRWAQDKHQYADARQAYQEYLRNRGDTIEAAQAWWGVGEASFQLSDWSRAEDALRSLIDKFPNHTLVERAYYRLVDVYRKLGRADEAEQVSAVLRKRFPESGLTAAALLADGREAFKSRQYPRAVELFDLFLKQYPEHQEAPKATANLAASLYLAGDLPDHWQRAADLYAELGRKHPAIAPDAFFWAGSAYLEAGKASKAVDALQIFLKSQPANPYAPRGQLLLGRALVALENYPEAVETLRQAVKAAGDDASLKAEGQYELAWALIGAGKADEGYATFQALAKEQPNHSLAADARFRLAGRAYEKGSYDQAVTAYDAWLKDYPEHALRPKVLYNLAFALEAKRDYAAAAKRYAEAEAVLGGDEPDLRQQAAYRSGYTLYKAGDPAAALTALEGFEKKYPESKLRVESQYYRGQALSAQSSWEAAGQVFKKVAEDHPDHLLAPSARFNYGVTLQNRQEYEAAIKVYQQVAGQTGLPSDLVAEAQLRLGETLYALKRYDEALDALLRAELGPVADFKTPARYWSALCYQAKGETAKARQKLQQVVGDGAGTPWAEKARKALQELGG